MQLCHCAIVSLCPPDGNQKQKLQEIRSNLRDENVIIEARLNDDGLYAADTTSLSKLNVTVFPRMQCSTLAQAVFFLHYSLGHMPKVGMLYLAMI